MLENADARNGTDARVIFVAIQQRFAINEKIGVRQAIVFQDNALFFLLKEPFYKAEHSVFGAFVVVKKISKYFAIPVNFCY